MNDKEEIVKFLLWLRKNRGWIFDSLSYSDEYFESQIRHYLEEYIAKGIAAELSFQERWEKVCDYLNETRLDRQLGKEEE